MCVQNISLYVQDATTSDLLFSFKYIGENWKFIYQIPVKKNLFSLHYSFFKQKTWVIVWPYIMSVQYK